MSPIRPWEDLLAEAGDAGFDVLPESDYDVSIIKAEAKMSQNGKQMFVVTAEIENGPFASRRLFNNFVLTHDNPVALGIFFRQMAILGLDKDFFKTDPNDATVAQQLVGKRARVQVGIRKWQGQDRNQITAWYPAGSGAGALGTTPPPPPSHAAPAPSAQPVPPPPVATPAPAPVNQPPVPPPPPIPSTQESAQPVPPIPENKEPVTAGASSTAPPPAPF